MNTTTKTVILALMIMSATLLSGCITDADTAKEDDTLERMTQLEAILTDPEFREDGEMMAKAVAEMEAITGEKYELKSEVNETPVSNVTIRRYLVTSSLAEVSPDHVAGIGTFTLTISDCPDFKYLKEVRVFVNNETIEVFIPAINDHRPNGCDYRKIECDIIGEWNIRIEGIYEDGTVQKMVSGTWKGLRDINDLPDAGALGERYIEPSATSRDEAKRIAEENGVVWGDDRDIPTPTPTFPKAAPTTVATPEPKPTLPKYYMIDTIIDRTPWNKGTIALVSARPVSRGSDIFEHVNHIKIYVDDQIIATIEPTMPKYDYRYKIEYPIIINLPDDVSNTGEITMSISVFDLDLNVDDGDYIIPVYARTPPMGYEEEYSQFPVWNP